MQYLKKMDLIQALLILLSIRSLIEINFAQAFVTLGIFGLFAYEKYMASKKQPDIGEELRKEMSILRDQMGNVALKNGIKTNNTQPVVTKRLF